MDIVELSNLSRQYIFTCKDIQKPKCEACKIFFDKVRPDVTTKALNARIQSFDYIFFS